MTDFMSDGVYLRGRTARELYEGVRNLPIIDYHCHLDPAKIAADASWHDLGELWLESDHYKWRAMRMCGVDERFITGDADSKDKFIKYAEIVPELAGSPLYYWTHAELKRIFGVTCPLNGDTAERVYTETRAKLKDISVSSLLRLFGVEFVATTDDPADGLETHGKYGGVVVTPTFRPDKLFDFSNGYLQRLSAVAHKRIDGLCDLLEVLEDRLDFFVSKGCRMSDHGFARFPTRYADMSEAEELFRKRDGGLTDPEREALFGFLLAWLSKKYGERGITMQLHFSALRNVNTAAYALLGADSGLDVIGDVQDTENIVSFLNATENSERPRTLLYTLNDVGIKALSAVSGAFRNVVPGAAWWFNDTANGIRRSIEVAAEYGVLGRVPGMLSDSRSFSSYVRFDMYRRIMCDTVGAFVDEGVYDRLAADRLLYDVCYGNAKGLVS